MLKQPIAAADASSRMHARVLQALRAGLLAAAALVLALLASGCGSAATTLDPVAQAAEVTSNVGGAHLALTARVSSGALPGPVTVSGEGFFNYRTHEGSLTIALTGIPATGVPGLEGGLHMQELFKDTSVYVGSSLFAGKLPNGARWLKLDLARFSQALGVGLQGLTSGQSNPAQILEYLRASAGGVTAVGHEAVRGVSTTHYRGSIDLEKVAEVLPGANRAQLRTTLQKLVAQIGLKMLPVDVWVDGHGLVRRFSVATSTNAAALPVSSQVSVELFDFGATPTVTAPPAGETYDATATALGALSGG